jgi:hypothetical protein
VSGWGRTFQVLYLACFLLIVAGLVIVFISLKLAAFLMLAGVVGMFGVRAVYIAIAYRRTMRRPWPRVRPLEDDDDW